MEEDDKYVYLELEGIPFSAANTADIRLDNSLSSISFRLPVDWARKLGLIEPEKTPGTIYTDCGIKPCEPLTEFATLDEFLACPDTTAALEDSHPVETKIDMVPIREDAIPALIKLPAAGLEIDPDREEDLRRRAAMNASYGLDLLTRSLPMPKWARYVVHLSDDCKSVSVVLVTKRKNPQWPNWGKIGPLVPCERIVEDVDPDSRCPRKTMFF
jgi:hypothetical protein